MLVFIYPFLTLCLFPILLFSHDQDTTQQRRLSVGIHVIPNYAYRFLNGESLENNPSIIEHEERAAFRYSVGFTTLYKLNRKIEFGWGVLYANKGYDLTLTSLIHGNTIDTTFSSYELHYDYLEIPFEFNYSPVISKRKILFSLRISPGVNISYRSYSRTQYQDGSLLNRYHNPGSDFTQIRRWSLAMYAGIGSYFNLSKNISLRIEPVFTCSLIPVRVESVPLQEILYSLGIITGIYFKL